MIEVVQELHCRLLKYPIWNEACLDAAHVNLRPSRGPEWWLRQENSPQMRDGAIDKWDILMD
eukprot:scaffold8245_cov84-Amphora_coffeaeformis.AAC.1